MNKKTRKQDEKRRKSEPKLTVSQPLKVLKFCQVLPKEKNEISNEIHAKNKTK
jgi:hypothetical protein